MALHAMRDFWGSDRGEWKSELMQKHPTKIRLKTLRNGGIMLQLHSDSSAHPTNSSTLFRCPVDNYTSYYFVLYNLYVDWLYLEMLFESFSICLNWMAFYFLISIFKI
jgi:hypothetical protein